MNEPLFTGVCTALITPFLDGKVNYPMLEMLLKRQIEAGVPAVVLAGTTGESPTLSDDEKLEMIKRCADYAQGRCKIIAGTGSNSTEHTVSLSIDAEKAGADALLVVSPYYNKTTDDGLFYHYMSVAHAVRIPVILYNVPSRTGVDIPVSVYKRLSTVANIVGVKEASTCISKIARIREQCPEDFHVWSGNDDMIVPIMSLGGKGVISVISNIIPRETLLMTESAQLNDYKTASTLQAELMPLIDLMFCEVNPIPIKTAMQLIGFDCGECRLPLCPMTQANKAKLIEYFSH